MNILLVEDDYLLGRSRVQLLERSELHKVRFTHKAADVFKHCQNGWTELVILDMNLIGTSWQGKEVTGMDISRLLKTQSQTAHLPIMLLIPEKMDMDHGHCLGLSMADDLWVKTTKDPEGFLQRLALLAAGSGFQGLTASAS